MNPPERSKTDRIAFGFVLVASMVSSPFFQDAFLIATRSAAAGAPGVTVTVVVRVMPNHRAVIVTGVVALTAEVLIANAPLDARPLTIALAGTCRTAGLLLAILCSSLASVPRPSFGRMLVFVATLVVYAFGVMIIVDTRFDAKPPNVYRLSVLDARIGSGKGHPRNVLIPAWGPRQRAEWHTVNDDLYRQVSPGSTICIEQFTGALGVGWYALRACG